MREWFANPNQFLSDLSLAVLHAASSSAELRLYAARRFSSSLSPATCPSIACSRFGPNTTSPSNRMNSISVQTHGHSSLSSYSLAIVFPVVTGFSSSAFMADLKPRMPSPIPLPSSGSFLGRKRARQFRKSPVDASVETILQT